MAVMTSGGLFSQALFITVLYSGLSYTLQNGRTPNPPRW